MTVEVADEATTLFEEGTLLEDLISEVGFGDWLDMDITAAEENQDQGAGAGDIDGVRFTLIELEATGPAGADLSFFTSIDLYVEAPDLDPVRVVSASDFPAGQALVVFELAEVDLTDFVVSQSMTVAAEVTGHRTDQDTTVTARFILDVTLTSQAACTALSGVRSDTGT